MRFSTPFYAHLNKIVAGDDAARLTIEDDCHRSVRTGMSEE
jgi:hypothetical protein